MMNELSAFEKEVVITGMKHMFQGTHFSICDLDKLIKITGGIPNAKDYNALSALHCVSWAAMSPELRETVMEKAVALLSSEGFNIDELELHFNDEQKVFEMPQKKGLFKRLVG
jgi:hypothetical protein